MLKTESKEAGQLEKYYIIAIILLSALCLVLIVFALYEIKKQGYMRKLAARFGLVARGKNAPMDFAVEGWKNCLSKLDYKCDAVFFGDSITRASDFRDYFEDVKICNLGFAGDTLEGMKKRVPMIAEVKPKKVFILGGINSLRDNNVDMTYKSYSELLDLIRGAVPEAEIYVQSLLPVGSQKEKKWYGKGLVKNSTIRCFNERLKVLVSEKGMTWVNIYSEYEKNGMMDPKYTTDGLHIYDNYGPWAKVIKEYIYN